MKTKAIKSVIISITSIILLSACGNSNTKSTLTDINSLTATDSNAEIASDDESEETVGNQVINNNEDGEGIDTKEEAESVLRKGTWFILDGEESLGYIALNDNSCDGIFYDFRDSSDSFFVYEYSNNILTFNLEGDDYSGELVQSDEDTYTLTISEGECWSIEFVSEKNAGDFRFYTSEELCSMALNYFEANYSYRPTGVSYINNSDQTITIHLYDDSNNQITTSVWYTVNRITAVGIEELSNEEVCLLDYEKDAIAERTEK